MALVNHERLAFLAYQIIEQELEKLGVDITPSKIEGKAASEERTETKGVSSSAWNSAGTWYELY